MVRMRVNREGFNRLRTLTEALDLDEGDKRGPLLVELDREHIRQVRRAFATRGASVDTGPWPAWSERYAAWRHKHRGRLGNRMMVLTASLFGKAVSPSHGDHVAEWLGGLRWIFGFADDVGWMHQEGGPILPKRSVIDKTTEDHARFVNIFVDFWNKRVDQALRHL